MNMLGMRTEFDRLLRSFGDSTFADYRDDYINAAWAKISTFFVIPALKREASIDVVDNQSTYLFPYDYGGAECYLWFKPSSAASPDRLDPVTEEILGLIYEKRSGSRGRVQYYDWTTPVGSDLATRTATVTNGSATVTCATAAAADVGHWVRFDPFAVGGINYNPGDYGYRVTGATVGVSVTLDRAYRGPTGTTTMRVRPTGQQQFVIYGTPTASVTGGLTLMYYANPRRLYDNADVPEWPAMGLPIVYMAISIGYDYIQHAEAARTWWGRATAVLQNLQRRKNMAQRLVTDLTIGSVSGRRTGPTGVIE